MYDTKKHFKEMYEKVYNSTVQNVDIIEMDYTMEFLPREYWEKIHERHGQMGIRWQEAVFLYSSRDEGWRASNNYIVGQWTSLVNCPYYANY